MDRTAILEGLNEAQRDAVLCTEGPVLIVAGAGSGKTRVLTDRIANILCGGCDPSRVLALTFTKKAAAEMKERVGLLVGRRVASKLYMGTFHSVFIRILRDYAESMGYPRSFTIYDTGDSTSCIKNCIRELKLEEKLYRPKDVLSRISLAKNNLVTAQMYAANAAAISNDTRHKMPRIWEIYRLYAQKCIQAGVMDFDDVLLNLNALLRDNRQALKEITDRFSYIMVDEYQDTNTAQYFILRRLAQFHGNLCVVGDDSQSIYGFRGARIENILSFRKDYPDLHIFKLEQNYRSTKTIVEAANSLIEKNSGRIPKKCFASGPKGAPIHLVSAYTEREEAVLIADRILASIMKHSSQYQDYAVLYRTNAQSRALEEALRRRNVPYAVYSGNSFYERAEVKDVMAYFKLAVNVNDDESFRRVVNKPARGIGDTTLAALAAAAHEKQCSLFRAVYEGDTESFGLKAAALAKLKAFADMVSRFSVRAATGPAFEVATAIAEESGILTFYRADRSVEGQARLANVEELLNSVQIFVEERGEEICEELEADGAADGSAADADYSADAADDVDGETRRNAEASVRLSEYLENIMLLSAVDVADEETANRVALMTVHTAKGLEFPYVYVVGMEENLFPGGGVLAAPDEIEEERRLFYVAMTRAKEELTLSFASGRMRNGKSESNAPSRFIKEIDPQYIANPLSSDDRFGASSEQSWGRSSFWGGSRASASRPSIPSVAGHSQSSASRLSTPSAAGHSAARPAARQTGSRPAAARLSPNHPAANRPVTARPETDFEPTPVLELRPGDRVEHNRFGYGVIDSIEGGMAELKAVITFDEFGRKTLLLKYAKIRKI